MVIKDLDLKPKIDAMMRDVLEYHIVPFKELNGVPVALVARFGVISKSTDRIVSFILNSLNKDYDQFVQNYNMHIIWKSIVELHAMLKLYENGIPKKAETPTMLAIQEGKISKDKKKPQGAKGKDKGKIPPLPKRDNPAKEELEEELSILPS
ncbi:hypothetical protein Tco_0967489 [Tanacetum coccineum]